MTKVCSTVPSTFADVAQDASIPVSGFLTVTKVIREHHDLRVRRGYGESIGQMVDQYLVDCLMRGDEVQEVTVGFTPELWAAMREDAK